MYNSFTVDFGHCLSGFDTGCRFGGYKEEVLTREIGEALITKLKARGVTVNEVRVDYGQSVLSSLNTRLSKINYIFEPGLSISIHINAGGGRGTEIYTKNGAKLGEATRILAEFEKLGYRNRGIKNGNHLALVNGINGDAMLIECCFIDTEDMQNYNADKFANAIINGLLGGSAVPEQPQAKKDYVLLKYAPSWRIYPLEATPVAGNEKGFLNPRDYGDNGILTYEILDRPKANMVTIQTRDFGKGNIYLPPNDPEWEIVRK